MSNFQSRHIGPSDKEIQEMLNVTGNDSVATLIDKTIPSHIRLESELNVEKALSEQECQDLLYKLGQKNKIYKSFIGLGYHETIVPAVNFRNILENPGWYTAYTPYQAEVAQGLSLIHI